LGSELVFDTPLTSAVRDKSIHKAMANKDLGFQFPGLFDAIVRCCYDYEIL